MVLISGTDCKEKQPSNIEKKLVESVVTNKGIVLNDIQFWNIPATVVAKAVFKSGIDFKE